MPTTGPDHPTSNGSVPDQLTDLCGHSHVPVRMKLPDVLPRRCRSSPLTRLRSGSTYPRPTTRPEVTSVT